MEPEDKHAGYRNDGDNATFDVVEGFGQVDKRKNRDKFHHVERNDVKRKSVFMEMPIE